MVSDVNLDAKRSLAGSESISSINFVKKNLWIIPSINFVKKNLWIYMTWDIYGKRWAIITNQFRRDILT